MQFKGQASRVMAAEGQAVGGSVCVLRCCDAVFSSRNKNIIFFHRTYGNLFDVAGARCTIKEFGKRGLKHFFFQRGHQFIFGGKIDDCDIHFLKKSIIEKVGKKVNFVVSSFKIAKILERRCSENM